MVLAMLGGVPARAVEPLCYASFSNLSADNSVDRERVAETYRALVDIVKDPNAKRSLLESVVESQNPLALPQGDLDVQHISLKVAQLLRMLESIGWTKKQAEAVMVREAHRITQEMESQGKQRQLVAKLNGEDFETRVKDTWAIGVSPNAHFLVGTLKRNKDGNSGLFVANNATGKIIRSRRLHPELDEEPQFNADNTRIVYRDDEGFHVVAFDGKTLRKIKRPKNSPPLGAVGQAHATSNPNYFIFAKRNGREDSGLHLFDVRTQTATLVPGTEGIKSSQYTDYFGEGWYLAPGTNRLFIRKEREADLIYSMTTLDENGQPGTWTEVLRTPSIHFANENKLAADEHHLILLQYPKFAHTTIFPIGGKPIELPPAHNDTPYSEAHLHPDGKTAILIHRPLGGDAYASKFDLRTGKHLGFMNLPGKGRVHLISEGEMLLQRGGGAHFIGLKGKWKKP